ncbi:hypothetical protein JOQ06_011706, partial [Pogonophryne albipinna]
RPFDTHVCQRASRRLSAQQRAVLPPSDVLLSATWRRQGRFVRLHTQNKYNGPVAHLSEGKNVLAFTVYLPHMRPFPPL